jgi:TctA family transporter
MLVILNLPLIGIWIRLLTVPYRFLFPAIAAFCCIGVYSVNNNTFDVYMVALFACWASRSTACAASRHRCCWASSSGR